MTRPVRWLLIVLTAAGSLCAAALPRAVRAQDATPTVSFGRSAAVVAEGAGRATVPVYLSSAPSGDVEVAVALRGGTATLDDVTLAAEPAVLRFDASTPLRQHVTLSVTADQAEEGIEFIDVFFQRADVPVGDHAATRLWIRDDSLYGGAIADVLAESLRADFAPSAALTVPAAADSLLSVVWNEEGVVRGVFGQEQAPITGARQAAVETREAGLVAEPVWPVARTQAEPLQRDLHTLVPMHRDVYRAHQSMRSATKSASKVEDYRTPRPGLQGDVARAILYTHLMYPSRVTKEALRPLYATLARWMEEDPIDDREVQRTTRIARYQGHPNPFVLAPELVEAAFNLRDTYPTPTVSFAQSGAIVSEQDSVAVLEVVASGVGDEPVTLTVGLEAGTSTAAADDVGGFRTRTVSFPGGTADGTTRQVRVPIVLDDADEETERATFILRDASGFTRFGETEQFVLDIENARRPAEEGEGRIVLGPAYPNPLSPGRGSTVRFEVSMNEDVPFTVEVFSTLGQRVRRKQYSASEAGRLNAIEIDGRDLPSGLYIVRLRGPSVSITETFVVVR